jgi:hypothetical protein
MGTKPEGETKEKGASEEAPTADALIGDAIEAEDDRQAAEEASEIADEDEAVVEDARDARVP